MGMIKEILRSTGGKSFTPVQASRDLFEELQGHLPSEPIVQLRPQKDNPGLDAAKGLTSDLYHYRETKFGKNDSPVNSWEIWYDEGEIRFYVHPDTQEQKNSAKKHIQDRYPGTAMSEEKEMFPKINEGDYIAGGRLTLSENYARPLTMPGGTTGFNRDPLGPITSALVAEGERTDQGKLIRPEEVRMVVQIAFKPISKDWTRGGLLGEDLNDFADELKKPQLKSQKHQFVAALFGQEPPTREPTSKQKKTAKMVSELRGEPGFETRIRILCISPYEEIVRQHLKEVEEIFRNEYYNQVTEQGLDIHPVTGDELTEFMQSMASREVVLSRLSKLSNYRDILSAQELAGMVHLPNESIEAPTVNWTMAKQGAGVPTGAPDLDDVSEEINNHKRKTASGPGIQEDSTPMETFSPESVKAEEAFDLSIDTGDRFEDRTSETPEPDGRGLSTDQYFNGEEFDPGQGSERRREDQQGYHDEGERPPQNNLPVVDDREEPRHQERHQANGAEKAQEAAADSETGSSDATRRDPKVPPSEEGPRRQDEIPDIDIGLEDLEDENDH